MRYRRIGSAVVLGVCLGHPAASQRLPAGEIFLTPLPKGFFVGSNQATPAVSMQQMVPARETIHDWTEMVTVQVFHGARNAPPTRYLTFMYGRFAQSCPTVGAGTLSSMAVNGYPAVIQKMSCSRDPVTGKPETTIFEAISGADSLYVAQYAFASMPTKDTLQKAIAYMSSISVCDSRTPQHSCPDLAAKGFRPM